jgi:putative ubiquitin-RnfH superfamily antitoxin RatB of RatAB toxin-antitoxin module
MIRISIVVALPGRQEVVELELAEGCVVADAIAAASACGQLRGCESPAAAAIWARECGMDTPLRDGDRVELLRPLKADAKAQRRARARLRASSTRSRSAP